MTNAISTHRIFTIWVVALLCSSFIITESPKPYTHCAIENTAFKSGERLTHKVYYNWNFVWMGAGETVSNVTNLGNQYKIDITGKTYPSYDWFYRIRDYYEVKVNKESLLPTISFRNIEEGGYKLYDKVYIDQNKQKATSERGKTKDEAIKHTFDVDACIHDIVSMVYFFRNVDYHSYEKGKAFPMKIFMDRKVWNLRLEYKGKKRIHIRDKGKFNALELSCKVTAGELFDENSSVTIWVSDDENRVPLQAKLELAIGSIKIVLKDYKGLKHPLTSKIKK